MDPYFRKTLDALELIQQGATEKGRDALRYILKNKWKILKKGWKGVLLISVIIGVINNLGNVDKAIDTINNICD